jgi:hypothetical protein
VGYFKYSELVLFIDQNLHQSALWVLYTHIIILPEHNNVMRHLGSAAYLPGHNIDKLFSKIRDLNNLHDLASCVFWLSKLLTVLFHSQNNRERVAYDVMKELFLFLWFNITFRYFAKVFDSHYLCLINL